MKEEMQADPQTRREEDAFRGITINKDMPEPKKPAFGAPPPHTRPATADQLVTAHVTPPPPVASCSRRLRPLPGIQEAVEIWRKHASQ
ncbi:myosin binding protein Ca [Lates japonicus]|uniref:Myosin binding protein Ca n=1 Tax=Lates japonicus TaxID=270547 RepID=A0AAD3QZW8_LATJO|nr:myosin binding protein Ca [Lates japonicus]